MSTTQNTTPEPALTATVSPQTTPYHMPPLDQSPTPILPTSTPPTPQTIPDRLRAILKTTPGLLWTALLALWFSAYLVWFVSADGIARTDRTLQTVGLVSEPNIVSAEKIRADFAGMNANATNAFFITGTEATPAQLQQLASMQNRYEAERQDAADELVLAAKNNTAENRALVTTMNEQLEVYNGMVEYARALGYPDGVPILRQSSTYLHLKLFPATDQLDAINTQQLEWEYARSQQAASGVTIGFLFVAALFFVALIATQFLLQQRTHRLLNIPLALATLILLIFFFGLIGTLTKANNNLVAAKTNAYDSINVLWKARAVAYDAKGDESLYLLDGGCPVYEETFHDKTVQMADIALTPDVLASVGADPHSVSFTGYLGDELRNITYPGESEAAFGALRSYGKFLVIDRKIRRLETAGHTEAAIQLCIGERPGQANGAFRQFDSFVQEALKINTTEFDSSMAQATADLAWLPTLTPIVILLLALLVWLGLQPRIQEYRG